MSGALREKTCAECGARKPLSSFRKEPRVRDGVTAKCSECLNAIIRARNAPPCSVDGCTGKSRIRGWCYAHYSRWARTGDLGPAEIWDRKRGGRLKPKTYFELHKALRLQRGKAASHECVTCGGRAYNWAYDHSDPNPRFSPTGLIYSLDLSKYQPMCVPCHRVLDREKAA